MEKIAASIIVDIHSDHLGVVLEKIAANTPDWVRKANLLNQDQLDLLSDVDFALVYVGDGEKKRYFPIVDKAHTYLSLKYFIVVKDKLPEKARAIAANMLDYAIYEHDLRQVMPEAFSKQVTEALEKAKEEGKNVPIVPWGAPNCPSVHNNVYSLINTMKGKRISISPEEKEEKDPDPVPDSISTTLDKTAGLDKTAYGIITPEGKCFYPLSTRDEVDTAVRHFVKHGSALAPEYQAMYANNIFKAAETHNVPVTEPELLRFKKSSVDMDKVHNELAVRLRKSAGVYHRLYKALLIKTASLEPLDFLKLLIGIDKNAGLDTIWERHNPLDLIVFKKPVELVKTASGVTVDAEKLRALSADPTLLQTYFEPKLASAFVMDPVGTFTKQPAPVQEVILRMTRGEIS